MRENYDNAWETIIGGAGRGIIPRRMIYNYAGILYMGEFSTTNGISAARIVAAFRDFAMREFAEFAA
jgi:hypothetical protein